MAHPKTDFATKNHYIESALERDFLYFDVGDQAGEAENIRQKMKRANTVISRKMKSSVLGTPITPLRISPRVSFKDHYNDSSNTPLQTGSPGRLRRN